MRLLSTAIALGASLLLSSAAWADSGADPQELQREAVRHSGWGDHRGAVARLEQACESAPSSDCLVLLAREQEALARQDGEVTGLDRALQTLRHALLLETSALQRQALSERIERLDRERRSITALPEPAGAVPIGFRSDTKDPYVVTVGGKTCETPCSLDLFPGHYRLVTGAGSLQLRLQVDATTRGVVHLAPTAERYLLPGIVLTVLGSVVGATGWLFAALPGCAEANDACGPANVIVWPIVGGAMFFTGVGLLGYWSGHHQADAVVQPDADPHAARQAPGFTLASFGIQPTRGGATAGPGFTF